MAFNRLPSWIGSRNRMSMVDSPMHKHVKAGNLSDLVKLLEEGADIDETDDQGNTALMLSAKYGYENILKGLIKRGANICVTNHDDEDVLRIAVLNKDNGTLKTLVEALSDAGRPRRNGDDPVTSSVGRAVCEAASLGFCDKIELLSRLHPNMNVCGDDGNTIFHYAGKSNEHEVIETFGRILDINVQNEENGDTPLHVACKHGSHETIIALLEENANVSISNETGDNALHCFARMSSRSPEKSEEHKHVLELYIDRWVRWWFKEESVVAQTKEDYHRYRIQAVHILTREKENDDGKTVMDIAFETGSASVIETLLCLDNITRFDLPKHRQYDVTNVTTRGKISFFKTNKSRKSYLELLLENNPNQMIAKVLDIEPLKKIEVMYTSLTTLIYLIIILLHTLYMSLFSYSSTVLMDRIREPAGNNTISMDITTVIFYGVVPIEPLFFLLILVYRFHCSKTPWIHLKFLTPGTFLLRCFSIIHHAVYICLVTAVIYQYFTMDLHNLHNTLSVTLLIGWLTTLSFTQGLKPIRFFWRMILQMIAIDVYKILFVYAFVLLSFSFALHVQFQISSTVIHTYPTPFHTMFLVFRLMFGMSELFDGDFESNIEKAGGSLALPIILFIIYIVLATVILLNLLIAMMNTSYSDILTNLKLSRRVETVQRAINLEITIPWLTRLISKRVIKCGNVDFENGRIIPTETGPDGMIWFVEIARRHDSTLGSKSHQSNVAMEQSLTERMTVLENKVIEHLEVLQDRLEEIHSALISHKNKTTD